jgi:hypothetical protein
MASINPNWLPLYYRTKPGTTAINLFIRLLMQGYVELFIASMLSIDLTSKIDLIFTNFTDAFSYLCGLFFFISLSSLPIVIGRAMNKKIDMLEFQFLFDRDKEALPIEKKKMKLMREKFD